MSMVAVYTAADGSVAILRPAPWGRRVSRVTLDGESVEFDLPLSIERVIHDLRAMSGELALRPVRQIDVNSLNPVWAESEEEFVLRIAAKDAPATAQDIKVLPCEGVLRPQTGPDDLLCVYRDAFARAPDGSVVIDMAKARDIHLRPIRDARDRELAALDGPHWRAMEAGDQGEQDRIAARKQALRDFPATLAPALAAAQTLDDLAAITVDVSKIGAS